MKRIFIITLSVIACFVCQYIPVSAAEQEFNVDELGYSEYGYIVKLKNNDFRLMSDDGNGIGADIYHAKSKEDIQSKFKAEDIEFVIKDIPLEEYDAYTAPNDQYYPQQWQFEACNIPEYTKSGITGKDIRIGIIDSGINTDFLDFSKQNIEQGINTAAYMNDDEEHLYDVTDYTGHGTKVASVIAAKSNNGIGMAGILNDCTIVPIRIYDEETQMMSASTLLLGLAYAQTQNLDVVNISLGNALDTTDETNIELIELLNEYINELTESGTIVIAAVGNDGKKGNALTYPANCDNVIGVGAVERKGTEYVKADFSTANNSVWVTAPGKDIIVGSYDLLTTRSSYIPDNGTSFSAPIVTAAAAGAKQINPNLTATEFKELLKETSVDLEDKGYDINTGYGMVDFQRIYNRLTGIEEDNPDSTYGVITDISYDTAAQAFTGQIINRTEMDIPNLHQILAVYDETGRLMDIRSVMGIKAGESNQVTLEVENKPEVHAKLFLWTDRFSMEPYQDGKGSEYSITWGE